MRLSASSQPPAQSLRQERERAQLYVVPYIKNLMHASDQAVQELVAFADRNVADGTMSINCLVVAGFRHLRKWLLAILSNENSSAEQAPDLIESSTNIIYFGDWYNKKDPEHPPATNLAALWEWIAEGIGLPWVGGARVWLPGRMCDHDRRSHCFSREHSAFL